MEEFSLKTVIDKYIDKGFGSMNKNDFEVWIFHYLMENKFQGRRNYEISIDLKIPESKVKRLRYEAELKYGKASSERNYHRVCEQLKKVHFKKGGKCIQFVIEDIYLRKYLDSILKADGRFSDSSFNSEIVSMDYDDLNFFFNYNLEGKREIEKILKDAKKRLNDDNLTFKTLMVKVAEKTGASVVDFSLQALWQTVFSCLFT